MFGFGIRQGFVEFGTFRGIVLSRVGFECLMFWGFGLNFACSGLNLAFLGAFGDFVVFVDFGDA